MPKYISITVNGNNRQCLETIKAVIHHRLNKEIICIYIYIYKYIRAVIEFLVLEKRSVENFHKQLCPVYGSCAVNRSTVGHWVQRFKASGSEGTELHDRPRSGRTATATSPDILVDVIARSETINSNMYIKTLQKLKQRYLRVRPKQESRRHVASARQQPALTQVFEPRRQSLNLVGLCSPIPPIVMIWGCQISIFLGH
jgi:transposase